MPGFIDTHHHQFETALRSFLADGILINDGTGSPSGSITYFEGTSLSRFAPSSPAAGRSISTSCSAPSPSSDDGVTTVHDISQIHHSPAHSDAVVKALFDSGRRSVFGYFESAGAVPGNQYPQDATRLKNTFFASSDQLVTMIMGGEIYLGTATYDASWRLGRQLGLQVAAHILSPFGMRLTFDTIAQGQGGLPPHNNIGIGPDNLFVHMTGMSDMAWNVVKNSGAQVSLAVPIEMNMRHGAPALPARKLSGWSRRSASTWNAR